MSTVRFTDHNMPTMIQAIQPRDMLDAFRRTQRAWRIKINKKDRRRRLAEYAVAALFVVAFLGAVAGEWILLLAQLWK